VCGGTLTLGAARLDLGPLFGVQARKRERCTGVKLVADQPLAVHAIDGATNMAKLVIMMLSCIFLASCYDPSDSDLEQEISHLAKP
jgi:hypothetical protein